MGLSTLDPVRDFSEENFSRNFLPVDILGRAAKMFIISIVFCFLI